MRLLSFLASLMGMLSASSLAAQTGPSTLPPALGAENSWHLDLSTGGRVTIQLRPDAAPAHVERIKALTRRGFYNGLTFHRVVEGFMAQGGDPTGTGTGQSDLPNLNAEINALPHLRGAVAMARAQDMNSANSQFYIMFVPRLGMDDEYTVLGRVVSGMNFVDAIERGEPPANPSRIVRASIGSDNVPPMSAEELRAASAAMAAAAQAARPAPAMGIASGAPGAEARPPAADDSAPAAASATGAGEPSATPEPGQPEPAAPPVPAEAEAPPTPHAGQPPR